MTSLAVAAMLAAAACGKKGPPLPPLVKLPAAPANFAAERRGNTVDLLFTVPSANTDNTRPANVARVDVYAITSQQQLPADQILKRGSRVASVSVKTPRDPDNTIEEEEPEADMEPPEGSGLDQGVAARLAEQLDGAALVPAPPGKPSKRDAARNRDGVPPLLPVLPAPLTRTYVAVGVSSKDRKGPSSTPVRVPLIPPPPPPEAPRVTYTETAIRVAWTPVAGSQPVQRPVEGGELPSTPIGTQPTAILYNVYDTTPEGGPVRLTATPISEPQFSDTRMDWGQQRCYAVRTVETVSDLPVESDAAAPACVRLVDTFPPAPPANLQSSPLEGAINLIWDANAEKDLAGYIVLRGPSAGALTAITDTPIQVTTFLDRVRPGTRYTYAIEAVDKAGNVSAPSRTVEEAARE